MPLMEHLRELRSRLFKACVGILIGFVIGFLLRQWALELIEQPYCTLQGKSAPCSMLQLAPTDLFVLQLKLALYIGLIVAAPIWLYQLWAFIAPGLHRHERRWAYSFVAVAAPLFAAGSVLAYLVVHKGLKFLLNFGNNGLTTHLEITRYVDFVLGLMLMFGLAFEFPLIVTLLNLAGVLSAKRLLGWWRISVFIMFVFAAVVTPTPDPFGMSALAIPMVGLYFAAVGFAFLHDKRKARRQAAEYGAVDDDEASRLDENIDPVDELEPAGAVEPVAASDLTDSDQPRRRPRRFDDST